MKEKARDYLSRINGDMADYFNPTISEKERQVKKKLIETNLKELLKLLEQPASCKKCEAKAVNKNSNCPECGEQLRSYGMTKFYCVFCNKYSRKEAPSQTPETRDSQKMGLPTYGGLQGDNLQNKVK